MVHDEDDAARWLKKDFFRDPGEVGGEDPFEKFEVDVPESLE